MSDSSRQITIDFTDDQLAVLRDAPDDMSHRLTDEARAALSTTRRRPSSRTSGGCTRTRRRRATTGRVPPTDLLSVDRLYQSVRTAMKTALGDLTLPYRPARGRLQHAPGRWRAAPTSG